MNVKHLLHARLSAKDVNTVEVFSCPLRRPSSRGIPVKIAVLRTLLNPPYLLTSSLRILIPKRTMEIGPCWWPQPPGHKSGWQLQAFPAWVNKATHENSDEWSLQQGSARGSSQGQHLSLALVGPVETTSCLFWLKTVVRTSC